MEVGEPRITILAKKGATAGAHFHCDAACLIREIFKPVNIPEDHIDEIVCTQCKVAANEEDCSKVFFAVGGDPSAEKLKTRLIPTTQL